MSASGVLSKGITIGYKTASSATSYTDVPDLQEIPDLGGDVDTVEITTLTDSNKRYIEGIKDFGDLEFTFLYDNSSATSNFRLIRALEEAKTIAYWQVALPDGTKFQFTGSVSTTISGAGVGDALTFSAKITLNSNMEVVNPTA